MSIPQEMQPTYDAVWAYLGPFCDKHLNEEFEPLLARALEGLCNLDPSPLQSGRTRSWAAGIALAICQNSQEFDSGQHLHMSVSGLPRYFKTTATTAAKQATEIKEMLDIDRSNTEWLTTSQAKRDAEPDAPSEQHPPATLAEYLVRHGMRPSGMASLPNTPAFGKSGTRTPTKASTGGVADAAGQASPAAGAPQPRVVPRWYDGAGTDQSGDMHCIGIDIGGTQLRIALIDRDLNIVEVKKSANARTKTAAENCAPLVDFVLSKVAEGVKIAGIGIGCPGPLDMARGVVLNPPNLVGWDDFAIVEYFEQACHLPVFLNNDANVAGLGEAVAGAGRGCESVIFVGLSTGFGGAYVYKGELVVGAHGNAAEYWNMIVNDYPHHHKNANPGSLNEQAGGGGLSSMASIAFGRTVSTAELFDLYDAGDALAAKVIDDGAEALARGLANIMCTFDPDVVVVGGSVDLHHPFYLDLGVEKAQRYLIDPSSLHIARARFGDDAGLIGAVLLVP